jgi:hypothetical protein
LLHQFGIQVNGSFVFGFDHDRPDVFERTVRWIEGAHLENATFHILTPYPGTPLFRDLVSQARILHRDWELYDTAHAVFLPRHMTPEALEEGYGWSYETLFSLGSIWRRRPERAAAVLPYIAMSLLYKKSNWLWPFLIRYRLTGPVWRPLVEASRLRHIFYRSRLESDVPSKSEPTENSTGLSSPVLHDRAHDHAGLGDRRLVGEFHVMAEGIGLLDQPEVEDLRVSFAKRP